MADMRTMPERDSVERFVLYLSWFFFSAVQVLGLFSNWKHGIHDGGFLLALILLVPGSFLGFVLPFTLSQSFIVAVVVNVAIFAYLARYIPPASSRGRH